MPQSPNFLTDLVTIEHTLINGGSLKYNPDRADEMKGTFGSFNAYIALEATSFPVDIVNQLSLSVVFRWFTISGAIKTTEEFNWSAICNRRYSKIS